MEHIAERHKSGESIKTSDDVVAAITAITPELQGLAQAEELEGQLSARTIAALAAARAFDISIPREYGGLALNAADQRRVYSAIGKIAGSTGWVSWVTTTHVRWVAMLDRKAQDEVYGMDWRGPLISGVVTGNGPGTARAVDGGFLLEGKWPFCSGSSHTAWSFLGAVVEGADGVREHMLMLVPAADLEIVDDWNVSGMKATSSNTVRLAKPTFVPSYRVIGTMAALLGAWKSTPREDELYRNSFVTYTSLTSAAAPLGMAQGALDYYMARIGKRGITATDYKVQADAAVTHFQLVEAKSRIDAAERVLTADAVEMDERAAAGTSLDPVFHSKVRFDVAASVRACGEAIEILHRGSGASTIHLSNPMQRYARDVRVATVHAQFNYETCAEDYGRVLCGKFPFNVFGG